MTAAAGRHLRLEGLAKSYGGAPALRDVTLDLRGGRVHALLGENGAGKSTLIKVVAGAVRPDRGRVLLGGAALEIGDARAAHRAGFRVIHQEDAVVRGLSVAEALHLARPLPRRWGVAVDWPRMRRDARAALEALGAGHIDPDAAAARLPTGDRMLVRIAAALLPGEGGAEPVLTVLDEPTAALSAVESERLFAVVRRLAARGGAVLYVSHRLDEVMALAHDVSVLRDGRLVWTGPAAETTKRAVIRAMTGRAVRDGYPARTGVPGRGVVARLRDVRTDRLRGLALSLREGEVLGVAGLEGAGQGAFARLFLGLEPVRGGEATLGERPLPRSPAEAWRRGVAYVPPDRRGEGLMLGGSVRANVVLPHLGGFAARARAGAERARAEAMGRAVGLRAAGPEQPVGELSGGNQQKVVFARALLGRPRLLVLHEPTRGVDVGAKWDIYGLVRARAAEGCAVVLLSSDGPEVLGMADRILVLRAGRQAALVPAAGLAAADLFALAQGGAAA